MAKEILLYQPIYSYTAENFMRAMEDNKGQDICLRMNCPGGDVMAAMGMISKYNEHPGGKKVKVDGRAASMAAFFACMADDVECLDTSEFLFHRAAFPQWFENDKSLFTDEMKAMLQRHNDFLRASVENKIGGETFKKVTGKTLDEMFAMDSRIDVVMNAKQAQKAGLVSAVIPLNIAKRKEINAIAASEGIAAIYDETETITAEIKTENKMTIADVRANAEVYNALKADILAEDNDRVQAFYAFAEVDAKAVLEAIAKGEKYTMAFGAKMQAAAMKLGGVQAITEASAAAKPASDPEVTVDADAKKEADFDAAVTASVLERFNVNA